MRSLTARLLVILLTFMVGVSAATIWHKRPSAEISRTAHSRLTAALSSGQPQADAAPAVRYVYFNSHLTRGFQLAIGTLVALDSDGTWLRTDIQVDRTHGKLKLSKNVFCYVTVGGTWKMNEGGEIMLTAESCGYISEFFPADGGHPAKFPLTVRWTLVGGPLGTKNSLLRFGNEELRLLEKDKVAENNVNDLVDDFWTMLEAGHSVVSWRCLEEDMHLIK